MTDGFTGVEHAIEDTAFNQGRAAGIYTALCDATVLPGAKDATARCERCRAIVRGEPLRPTVPRQQRRRVRGRHRRENAPGPWVRLERV